MLTFSALGSNLTLLDRNLSIALTKPLELVGEVAPEVQALHKRLEPRYPLDNIEVYERNYAENKKWGPLLVTSQISAVQLIQLVARYWIRRGCKKRPKVSIDLPFGD